MNDKANRFIIKHGLNFLRIKLSRLNFASNARFITYFGNLGQNPNTEERKAELQVELMAAKTELVAAKTELVAVKAI
jgi:hypothetical protein